MLSEMLLYNKQMPMSIRPTCDEDVACLVQMTRRSARLTLLLPARACRSCRATASSKKM